MISPIICFQGNPGEELESGVDEEDVGSLTKRSLLSSGRHRHRTLQPAYDEPLNPERTRLAVNKQGEHGTDSVAKTLMNALAGQHR